VSVSESVPTGTTIDTRILMRIVVVLIAIWSLIAGTVLVFFHGAGSGALGAGVADESGQRLAGAQMLVLVPVYVLIAWKPDRYPMLPWLPFLGQVVVFFSVGYSILAGSTEFGDGILPVAVSGIFVGLLGFIWISEQRAIAHERMAAADEEDELDSSAWEDQPHIDEGHYGSL
jgi:hypothetical protein